MEKSQENFSRGILGGVIRRFCIAILGEPSATILARISRTFPSGICAGISGGFFQRLLHEIPLGISPWIYPTESPGIHLGYPLEMPTGDRAEDLFTILTGIFQKIPPQIPLIFFPGLLHLNFFLGYFKEFLLEFIQRFSGVLRFFFPIILDWINPAIIAVTFLLRFLTGSLAPGMLLGVLKEFVVGILQKVFLGFLKQKNVDKFSDRLISQPVIIKQFSILFFDIISDIFVLSQSIINQSINQYQILYFSSSINKN